MLTKHMNYTILADVLYRQKKESLLNNNRKKEQNYLIYFLKKLDLAKNITTNISRVTNI